MTKDTPRNSRKYEAIKESVDFIANLVTIGSAVIPMSLSLITGITLASQEETIYLPLINAPLGKEYLIAVIVSSLLAYLSFLRRVWQNEFDSKNSHSFLEFVLNELFFLKRPLLLIPLVFLLALSFTVSRQDSQSGPNSLWVFFVIVVMIFYFEYGLVKPSVDEDLEFLRYQRDIDRWMRRIEKSLENRGYVSTSDMIDSSGLDPHEYKIVNCALKIYYEEFEAEKYLKLSPVISKIYTREDGEEFEIKSQTLSIY